MKKRVILSIIAVLLIVACGTKVSEIKDSLTKPLTPTGLKVDSSTDTSVTLSWSAANTATSLLTTGYTIESATSEDFTKNSNKTTETKTTTTVGGLAGKGATYYFRVVANNSKANLSSAPSNVVSKVVGTAAVPTERQYSITIDFNWNTSNNTSSFGPVPSSAHFSPVVGSVHTDDASIYKTGTLASQGIKQMAETGGTSNLSSEIDVQITAGSAYYKMIGSGGSATGKKVVGNIRAKDTHHFFSLVSMIAPSPDWFIARRNIDLKESDGSWKDEIIIQMPGYDSGTDSGGTFTASNQVTNPAVNIFRFSGSDDITFATLTIKKL